MKKLIALMLIIGVIFMAFGCTPKSKSRIEQRFEQYVQENFYNPRDFEGFSAISLIDTFDVIDIGNGCIEQSDSINAMLTKAMEDMNKQLKTANSHAIENCRSEGISIAFKFMDVANGIHKRNTRKEHLAKLLESVDSAKAVNRLYVLKARIKGKIEIVPYYAMDCAVIDTILISDKPIQRKDAPDALTDIFNLIDEFVEENGSRLKLLGEILDLTQKLQLYS